MEQIWCSLRFEKLVTYQHGDSGDYRVDFAKFDNTYSVDDTPSCSARQMDERRKVSRKHIQLKLSILAIESRNEIIANRLSNNTDRPAIV